MSEIAAFFLCQSLCLGNNKKKGTSFVMINDGVVSIQ
uniref:Uncharacterized protein n=1 Tax=Arundo donax TaxID=35708 RepID=A0A0A9FG77_ARUDO